MWKRPLNSATLVVVTHRRLGGVSNGTNTQVMACIIKKWKAKINGKQPYNVRDPPEREGLEKSKRERERNIVANCS